MELIKKEIYFLKIKNNSMMIKMIKMNKVKDNSMMTKMMKNSQTKNNNNHNQRKEDDFVFIFHL